MMTTLSGPQTRRYDDPHVLARLVELKTTDIAGLKAKWRDLFETEPPPYNRKFLESRLAYRIQELAFGGLRPETLKRLEVLAQQMETTRGRGIILGRSQRPLAGTRLVREWQGVEHTVTVLRDGYEFQGRPFKSLSSVARAITGTRWNGWVFFGLKNTSGRGA
jgi:hypothetical protein